jgi:L-threonylcarbamoyladenylate synthase
VPFLKIDPISFDAEALAPAVRALRDGGVVAFPTDTFYGLAVDPRSAEAVRALFALKARRDDQAIPLIAGSRAQVADLVGPFGPAARALADRFWPGPLSILFDAPAALDPAVHAGTHAVAVRVPEHPIARALALAFGGPVTATSANQSGEPPVTSAAALAPLERRRALLVIDAGTTRGGDPSTIVDVRPGRARLVRAGAIAWDRVLESLQA